MPQRVTLKKLKLNGSMKTYKKSLEVVGVESPVQREGLEENPLGSSRDPWQLTKA